MNDISRFEGAMRKRFDPNKAEFDVIVIGGGFHGCSAALHLAKQGVSVLVLEKHTVARHASGVNAGGVRQLKRDFREVPLSMAAMEQWLNLESLLGSELARSCQFSGSVGQIAVALDDAGVEWCETRFQRGAQLGYNFEQLLTREQVRERIPKITPACKGGLLSARDGHANPARTTQAFRLRAEQLGAVVRERTRVTGLAHTGNNWLVETAVGTFRADTVINSAGAWAYQIAEQVGESLPRTHEAYSLMVTARLPKFVEPVVLGVGRTLSFKQTEAGTLVIGGGFLGNPDLEEGTAATVIERMKGSASTVLEFFPSLKHTVIVRTWAGLEAVTPDDIPVIGPSQTVPRLWHSFGYSGHGFQLAPSVGATLADLIVNGTAALSLDAFSPGRFAMDAQGEPNRMANQAH
jgi:sarcosine oxidase, subunit beta